MIKRRKLKVEELNRIDLQEFKQAKKIGLTVVLDNVRSLNNIGSVFRTSDAFRVNEILLCGITATPPQIDIHKTALGAEDSVSWRYFDETISAVNELKTDGFTVFSIDATVMVKDASRSSPSFFLTSTVNFVVPFDPLVGLTVIQSEPAPFFTCQSRLLSISKVLVLAFF